MKKQFNSKLMSFLLVLIMVLAIIPLASISVLAYSGTLENVQESDGVLTWDAFPGAAEYEYSFGPGGGFLDEPKLELEHMAKTFHLQTGEYNYSIHAVDEYGTQISEAIVGTYSYTNTQTPLDTPTNLVWNHTVASWDSVEGAEYYILLIYEYRDGNYSLVTYQGQYVYDGTSFDMGKRFEADKTYCFDVKACASYSDLDHVDSAYARSSNRTFESVVPSLTNVAIENGKLSFDNVAGAYEYEVLIAHIGGYSEALPIDLYELCSTNSLENGTYDITIKVFNENKEPLAPIYIYEDWEYDSSQAPSKLTGTLEITGTLKVGQTLTATLKDTNNTGTLTYNWYRSDPYVGWVLLQSSTNNTFVITEACANKQISVVAFSDNELSQVESENTGIIAEEDKAEILNGTVEIIGSLKYGETLTANVTSNNSGNLSYQWKRSGVDIVGANSPTYTLTVDDINNVIRVVVTSSVETGSIASNATSLIEKADGPLAPSGITSTNCTSKSNNDGTISGVTADMEYKLENGEWKNISSTTISNLSNGAYYVRVKETATHKASENTKVVINEYIATVYNVSFDSNGGTGNMSPVPVEEDEAYNLPSCGFLAPEDCEFKCWSVNGAEKAVGSSITITENTTITAIWQASPIKKIVITGMPELIVGNNIPVDKSYIILPNNAKYEVLGVGWYDYTDDSWVGSEDKFIVGHSYQFSVELLPKDGYQFAGNGEIEATINGNPAEVYKNGNRIMVMLLVGTPISYTVTFDGNGGSGSMESIEVGGNYVLPECGFTPPEGKVFDYWSVTGAGIKAPGQAIMITEDTTIIACWKEATAFYNISFEKGEYGEGSKPNEVVEAGTEYTIPQNPFTQKSKYYIFKGWLVNDTLRNPGDSYIVLSDITFTAVWTHKCAPDIVVGTSASCATETNGKQTYYHCEECGKNYSDENGENEINGIIENWGVISYSHNFTGEIVNVNASVHGYKCVNTDCQKIGNNEEHVFNELGFDAEAHWNSCECGAIGNTQSHSSKEKITGQGASCTVDGWNDCYLCECGNYFADEACTSIIADYEAWKTNEGKIIAEHNYGTLISEAPSEHTKDELKAGMMAHYKCSVCNAFFDEDQNEVSESDLVIPAPQHAYSNLEKDSNNHWNECECGAKSNTASHQDSDNNGKCDTCEYTMETPTPDSTPNTGTNPDPEPTPDPTPEPTPNPNEPNKAEKGLGTGAIVGIVIGSVLIVGIGAFALIWFVIKKKTFADLVLIFKKK